MNREDNRLQVFFDGKPDADTRAELKSNGFRWASSVGAWQRQLTDNAIRAADRLECIKPLSGEKPSQLQKKPSILQTMREQGEKVQTEPEKKAPSGRDARTVSLGPHWPEVFCCPGVYGGLPSTGSPDGKEVLCRKK